MFGQVDPEYEKKNPLTPEELEAFDHFVDWVDRYGLNIPAIMLSESLKPANFIMSTGMVMAEPVAHPLAQMLFRYDGYEKIRTALEKRHALEILCQKLEEREAERQVREKALKKWLKQEKKKWRWYQRYLGIFTPKLDIPDEVKNPPELASQQAKNEASASEKDTPGDAPH